MNKLFLLLMISVLITPSGRLGAEEETKRSTLREKLVQRWLEKQGKKPAPETSSDVTTKITASGDYSYSIEHGGLTRMYKGHVPKGYKSDKAAPLLVVLHGGGGDMNVQSTDEFYNQISKSDKEGFIAAFPNGYSKMKSGILATWNAGTCCAGARDNNIDDVGFIRQMIKNLSQQLNIDGKKIFATGMSNGGMMTYRLACEMPDVFKAIASVAGTDNTTSCAPKKAISVLHIHAQDDDHVLFSGGSGKAFGNNKELVADFVSVPATIEKWVKFDKCRDKAKRMTKKPGYYCELYSSCSNKTEVQLCVTDSGGHSWPGGKKPRGGGDPSTAMSANDVMWDFFTK